MGKGISKQKDYAKNYIRRMRQAVVAAMGGKCVVCDFSDPKALQIDHVNGGGIKERYPGRGGNVGGRGGNYNRQVLKSFLNHENKYQLLCANCNWIKRSDRNEQPGGEITLAKQFQK